MEVYDRGIDDLYQYGYHYGKCYGPVVHRELLIKRPLDFIINALHKYMIFRLIYAIVMITSREHLSGPKYKKRKESKQCH